MYDTFDISTSVTRSEDEEVLNFKVTCKPFNEEEQRTIDAPVAELKGYVHDCLSMPGAEAFHLYDARSGHCLEALTIMQKSRSMIKRQLPRLDFDFLERVILLERAWVDPSFRGKGLALRLMREAQHLFARPHAFAILKAHPDRAEEGEKITDAQCNRLAEYYGSDTQLGFKALSKKAKPGWMVAQWEAPTRESHKDQQFWSLDDEALGAD